MVTLAPPKRRPILTDLDKEMLARLLKQSQTPIEAYTRESALGVPWGSLANSLVGGMLVGRERSRARNLDEQRKKTEAAILGRLPTEVAEGMAVGDPIYDPETDQYSTISAAPVVAGVEGQTIEQLEKNELAKQYANLEPEAIERLQMRGVTIPQVLRSEYVPLSEREVLQPRELATGMTIEGSVEGKPNWVERNILGEVGPVTYETRAEAISDVYDEPLRFKMWEEQAKKGKEEKYETSFIATITNKKGESQVGRISEKIITNLDGSKTKIGTVYDTATNTYIPLEPGFNYSKIADKKNEIKPRYFVYNGDVDIEYKDTDGQIKILKPNDHFRIEGPGSPQALINLSQTQNVKEKKLIGDRGFASRPLVSMDNPGIIVASINGIVGGTGDYEETLVMRENFQVPYKDKNNVDQVHIYKAGESINNRDERFMPLFSLLQETTVGDVTTMRKAGFISAPKLLEQRSDLLQQGQGINALINYVNTIDQTSTGINRTIDTINSWFTTVFMPENQLDENEVAIRIANGQLSRLGGTQRVDILGPGVMTEFDFLRLQEALGGEPTSKQSIQAFKRTLNLILEEKMVKYNDSLAVYDGQRTKFGELRAEVIPPINLEIKEHKSFFEPSDYPSWNTGMIKRMETSDPMFADIVKVQKILGTNATNEDYLNFFNKRQWEAIKARLRLLGVQGVPK
tara:strand:- start:3650 stop:5710 length:2061 start_codon:yes stop_codon:yes gene_type:complete